MWRFLKDSTYYIIAYSLSQIIMILPRKLALSLGILLGDFYFYFGRSDRERTQRQIQISLGTSYRESTEITRRCFRNIGKNLVDFMRFPKLNADNINRLVKFRGKKYIDSVLRQGKGIIILTAHFGNWELIGAGLSLSGYPLNAIVRKIRSRTLNKLVKSYREKVGVVSIDRDKSVKQALRCLKRNELLGILADIDTDVDSIFVDFFGRLAYTPYGPVAISLKTGAALIPTFIVRQDDGSHCIFIEPPLSLYKSGDWKTDIRVNTSRFTKIIEDYIRRYPEQWIWMHRRWRTRPDGSS